MKRDALGFADTERVRLDEVPQRMKNVAVSIDAHMEELFSRAIEQNFVPVVDSRGVFCGIVRRRAVIVYLTELVSRVSPAS